MNQLIANLNHPDAEVRLSSLQKIKEQIDSGACEATAPGNDVNNHIHTTYSFSPYSPTMAVYMAYRAGLKTAGIMDHDSISGAREFIKAAEIMGVMSTIGIECRVDMSKTVLGNRRYNNPDQMGVAYMALHGIPHQNIDTVTEFFRPFAKARGERNRKMTDKINALLAAKNISIDYDNDVLPLSLSDIGGSVTERHLLYALSLKLIDTFGKGQAIVDFCSDINVKLSPKIKDFLLDCDNDFYAYDLLGALKGELVEQIYVDATDECPNVCDVLELSNKIGSISAYAYLGDVGQSVTGDKKTQSFEDSYLDELFVLLKDLSFSAVTYMPSRNTPEQLKRIRELCSMHELFEISGEDINSPRQKFICMAQRAPEFAHLYTSTMALIGHEKAATKNIEAAMFGAKAITKTPSLIKRTEEYAGMYI